MPEYVKNIALVGVSTIHLLTCPSPTNSTPGRRPSRQIRRFIPSGGQKFNLTAITRAESTSKVPEGFKRVDVDYNDHTTLVSAMQGIDVLIISLAVTSPPDTSEKLIRAAAAANVPYVFPNEWGLDHHFDPAVAKETLIGEGILATRRLIESLGVSKWIACVCGFWYEYSVAFSPMSYGFDFKNKKATFYDEGTTRMNTSTWDACGWAVAGALQLPIKSDSGPSLSDYENNFLYVSSFVMTQRDVLDSIHRVTGSTDADWTITKQDVKQRYGEGFAMMKDPKLGRLGFAQVLYSRGFYPDEPALFEARGTLCNDVLGLPKEDMDECTKRAIRMVEENGQLLPPS